MKPRIAGWLTLVAAAFALWNGLGALVDYELGVPGPTLSLDRYGACGIIVIAFGAVAIAGGLSSLYRKNLTLSMAGAALGAMGDGIIGAVCGLTALGLLFLSDMDF